MARIVPQPPIEGEEHLAQEEVPDLDDLPTFEELEEAEGSDRMSRKLRSYEVFLEPPKSISGDKSDSSEDLAVLDWRDYDESANVRLPVGYEDEAGKYAELQSSSEQYETLPDFNMTPDEAAVSKIPPWHFPNWVEPYREPEHMSKYTDHPEFFRDEIAEIQQQIDERKDKRRRRMEMQQPKFDQDPKLIDMTKYFTIAFVIVYFAFKQRRLLAGETYLDPEDDIRNERIIKLQ